MTDATEILQDIADGMDYDSDYDGRCYTRCAFCHCSLSEREDHDDDCLMNRARRELGSAWPRPVVEEVEEVPDWYVDYPPVVVPKKVACEYCGRKVHLYGNGMTQHQAMSAACKAERGIYEP